MDLTLLTFSTFQLQKDGKAPEDFLETLMDKYRNYSDDDVPEVFKFFVDNILGAVNCKVTKWSKYKTLEILQKRFTVSDEAFALLMVENYVASWEKKIEMKDSKLSRKDLLCQAKYSSSNTGRGNQQGDSSWSIDGIIRYNVLCREVEERRRRKRERLYLLLCFSLCACKCWAARERGFSASS